MPNLNRLDAFKHAEEVSKNEIKQENLAVVPLNFQGSENPDKIKKPKKSRFNDVAQVEVKEESTREGRKRKRKSRWINDEDDKSVVPGMPATVPMDLDPMQQKMYVLQLQIEDATRKLRTGDYGIPKNPEDRSPSPEPIYDGHGKRMNTREYRWKRRIQNNRHTCIQKLLAINPEFRPPADYKAPEIKLQERIEIPQEQFPQINFVGLLIGPRGLTLKKLERESGARIMIRGKGSVKESKLQGGRTFAAMDEPLHALITAGDDETLKKAVAMVTTTVKTAVETPNGENDLRKLQLMELAKMNGTLRENAFSGMAWLKEENQTLTNQTVCTVCGGRGHLASDCKQARPGTTHDLKGKFIQENRAALDSEYAALMNELGETTSMPLQSAMAGPSGGYSYAEFWIFLY